jgi:hypothetical protein
MKGAMTGLAKRAAIAPPQGREFARTQPDLSGSEAIQSPARIHLKLLDVFPAFPTNDVAYRAIRDVVSRRDIDLLYATSIKLPDARNFAIK